MTESERILQIIGHDAMSDLCREFGGETIYIPKHPPTPERDRIIYREFTTRLNEGTTCMNAYESVAEEYGISRRQVMRIVNE